MDDLKDTQRTTPSYPIDVFLIISDGKSHQRTEIGKEGSIVQTMSVWIVIRQKTEFGSH